MRGDNSMTVKELVEIVWWVMASTLSVVLNIPTLNTFLYQPAWRRFLTIGIPVIVVIFSIWRVRQIYIDISNKRKSSTDDYIFEELIRYKTKRPKLIDEIEKTIIQIEKIHSKFIELMEILKRNEMEAGFEYAIEIARNTQEILRNSVRALLNKITICDNDMYPRVFPNIERIVQRNDEIVNTFNDFLMQVSDMENDSREFDMAALNNLTEELKAHNEAYRSEIVKDGK